jgi:hypothetical protein
MSIGVKEVDRAVAWYFTTFDRFSDSGAYLPGEAYLGYRPGDYMQDD